MGFKNSKGGVKAIQEIDDCAFRLDADELAFRSSPLSLFSCDWPDANRPRYSRGGMPMLRMNAVRICSSLLKPQRWATDLTRLPGCTSRRRAASTRIASKFVSDFLFMEWDKMGLVRIVPGRSLNSLVAAKEPQFFEAAEWSLP